MVARMSAQKFINDSSGNIAIIFALVLASLVSIVGLAVDFQRSVTAEQTIQSALDSATLAAVSTMQNATKTDAEVQSIAKSIFAANIRTANASLVCPNPTIQLDMKNGTAEGTVLCTLPTTMAAMFSVKDVAIKRTSSATVSITKLDLAMMLDVSGSMQGQKLKDLKAASKNAIDILITPQSGDRVRIAFNTYSTSVNVGDYAKDVKGTNYNKKSSTKNCATERSGIAKYDDDAPASGKYIQEEKKATNNSALWCPKSSIKPLTSTKKTLQSEIDKLDANGMTAGHLGVAWAWYLISPLWDDIWPSESKPLAYDEPNSIKAIILMTDGEFNTYYQTGQGSSVSQSKKLCTSMKDEGVIVYSVAFQAPSSGKDVLKACATSSEHFFDASNGDELKAAYAAIASQLTNLRVTR